jgi:hypothetical protein
VNRFDADIRVGMSGLGLRAELVENSHWWFRPRRPVSRPVPSFLSVTSVEAVVLV